MDDPLTAADSHPPVLELRDVEKSFGVLRALDRVSLSLHAGETVALLGPNGAGKTTLIRCICGRTRMDRGTIKLLGHSADEAGIRNTLGLVPQEIALYGDLTTKENLYAFARFHGLSRRAARERVRWALQWTGLEQRKRDLVGYFSGGMKRRVNLACGVMHNPQVLLLDEPTVGVDPQSRQRIFAMLEELRRDGTTILLTTHQLDEAEQQSDRILILDQGKIIADGSKSELVEQSVGASRLVRIRVDRPLSSPLKLRSHLADSSDQSDPSETVGQTGDDIVMTRIDDVAHHLTELLASVRQNGYDVSDVEVHAPSLQHVFLHLTGNELRD